MNQLKYRVVAKILSILEFEGRLSIEFFYILYSIFRLLPTDLFWRFQYVKPL